LFSERRNNTSKILCIAWPYSNGDIHIGHVAGTFLPCSIYKRYSNLNSSGNTVISISGGDNYGSAILQKALKKKKSPKEISEYYFSRNKRILEKLCILPNCYGRTDSKKHIEWVNNCFAQLKRKGYIYNRNVKRPFCEDCSSLRTDREVEGICVHCSKKSYGDQCSSCGKLYEIKDLSEFMCTICSNAISFKPQEEIVLSLSKSETYIRELIYKSKNVWTKDAIKTSSNFIKEGLKDRSISRNISYGVPISNSYLVFYVWFEALLGYSGELHDISPELYLEWSKGNIPSWYFMGKDNIIFHTIIHPATQNLLSCSPDYRIVSSNYLLDKSDKKFSKSHGSLSIREYLKKMSVECLIFSLSWNLPQTHDVSLDINDMVDCYNNILINSILNFVSRILNLIEKKSKKNIFVASKSFYKENILPFTDSYHKNMKKIKIQKALREIQGLANYANKLVDSVYPWKNKNQKECDALYGNSFMIIKSLAFMLYPILPKISSKIMEYILCELKDGFKKEFKYTRNINSSFIIIKKIEI